MQGLSSHFKMVKFRIKILTFNYLKNTNMKVPNDIRSLIIKSYMNGNTIKQISSVCNVKYPTVNINVYKKEDRVETKLKGGVRKKKLNEKHVNAIRSWIDEDCSTTLKCINSKLEDKYSLTVVKKQ